DGRLVDIDLYFSDLCIGIDCPDGQTCADGQCVDIHTIPTGPDGALPSDAQAGTCNSELCWELPRPNGEFAYASCLTGPDTAFALGGTALRLESGIWYQEPVPPDAGVSYVMQCFSTDEVLAVGRPGAVIQRANGAWSVVAIPTAGDQYLWGVWGSSAD